MSTTIEPIILLIEDMQSDHCTIIIEKELSQIAGLEDFKVEFNNNRALIYSNKASIATDAVKRIKSLGYGVTSIKTTFPVLGLSVHRVRAVPKLLPDTQKELFIRQ